MRRLSVLLLVALPALAFNPGQLPDVSIPGPSSAMFGVELATVGDLDHDGYDDLLVGATNDDTLGNNAGAATVFYGSPSGIGLADSTVLTALDGLAGDNLGAQVASGYADFDGDGWGDVAVTAIYDSDRAFRNGSIYVWYGSSSGLVQADQQEVVPASLASFCCSLAVGDLDRDGYTELVAGHAYDRSVSIFPGGPGGVNVAGEQVLNDDDGFDNLWGLSVAVGDLNGDSWPEVIVGQPNDLGPGSLTNAGAVSVFVGSPSGLSSSPMKLTAASPAAFDRFGDALAVGDVNGDGTDDLVVGARGDTQSTVNLTGRVVVFLGSAAGIVPGTGVELTDPSAVAGDGFGWSVAVADVDGDGRGEVLVTNNEQGTTRLFEADATGVLAGSGVTLAPGIRKAFATTGADLNGDGADEIVTGDPSTNASDIDVWFGEPPPAQVLTDDIVARANQAWGGEVVREDQPSRLRPSTWRSHVDALTTELEAGGCTTPGSTPLVAGGSYDRRAFEGTWSSGTFAGSLLSGRRHRGTLDPGESFGTAFSARVPSGQHVADFSGGDLAAGRFVRVAGRRGVNWALLATCDGGAAPADALQAWYPGTLDAWD